MTRKIKTAVVAASIFMAAGSLCQAAEEWRVTRVSGDVWTLRDNAPARIVAGAVLNTGDVVRTGPQGRVQISRGAEAMMLGANTAIELAPGARPDVTSVLQQAGTLTLDIEKKSTPHFEVETPFLVAAVKGTRFVVTVRPTNASVNVARGLVQVASVKTGQAIAVAPGQKTSIGVATSALSVVGPGPHAAVEDGERRVTRAESLAVPKTGLASPFAARMAHAPRRKARLQRPATRPAQAAATPSAPESQNAVRAPAPAPANDAQDASNPYRDTIWTRGNVSRTGAPAQAR